MDLDSLLRSYLKDFEEKKNILFDINQEENRKCKTDIELLEKAYALRRDKHGLQNWKRFNEMQILEQKVMDKMIRRRFEPLRFKIPVISEFQFHRNDAPPPGAGMRDSGLDVIAGNMLRRSNPLLKNSKQTNQESEGIHIKMNSFRMKHQKFFLNRKIDRRPLYQRQRKSSASSFRNSKVTGNECGMERLLKKLNDISLQEFPDAHEDRTDFEMS